MNTSGQVEALETRRLFNISTFKASQGDDIIQIGMSDTGYFLNINGKRTDVPVNAADPDKAFYLDCMDGNDTVTVDPKYKYKVIIYLGPGNDTYSGSDSTKARESVFGDAGNDTILGNGGSDALYGGAGKDSINGGAGEDLITGDLGGDTFQGDGASKGAGNDTIIGGAGNDTISGGGGNDKIDAGDGNDYLCGNLGNDTISAGDGNDTIEAGLAPGKFSKNDGGTDIYDGGAGTNKVTVYSDIKVSISTDSIPNDGQFLNQVNQFLNLQRFSFYVAGGSTMDFSKSPSPITMDDHTELPADNRAERADTIIGSNFADSINDVVYGGYASYKALNVQGGAGNDTISGSSGDDTLLGGTGNDWIRGYLGSDSIEGNAGNDLLEGEGGRDTLYGNKGNDSLYGGNGNDDLFGGPDDADTVVGGASTDRAAEDEKDKYYTVEIKMV